jgi:hypothetical protein
MKLHTVKSNAKREARKLCEQFSGVVPVTPASAPHGRWYPAVSIADGCLPTTIAPEVVAGAVIIGLSEDYEIAHGEIRRKLKPEPEIETRRQARRERIANGETTKAEKGPSKSETLLTLVSRPGGATSEELQEALGWQAHTIRGYIAGTLRKRGHNIIKIGRGGVYRLETVAA